MDNRKFYKDSKENPCGKGRNYPKMMGNDASWRGGPAVKQIASFPFVNPVGSRLVEGTIKGTPGIMRINVEPSYGHNLGLQGSLQKAADAYFTYITQAYVGTNPSFEAADLIVIQRAIVDGLYVLITEGKRAYGLVRKYSNYNRYFARSVLQSIGWDFEDLKANLMNFEAEMNNYIARINAKFHIPNDNNIHRIKQNMFGRMYSDRPGKKYQMYAFVPTGYPKFEWNKLSTGSCLTFSARPDTYTFRSYFAKIDNLLDTLEGVQDVNIISGSFLRAYGESNCFKIPDLVTATETTIDFDPIMLNEIHNINLVPQTAVPAGEDTHIFFRRNFYAKNNFANEFASNPEELNTIILCQDKESHALVSDPYIDATDNAGLYDALKSINALIDISDEEPDADIILDSTAYKYGLSKVTNDNRAYYYVHGSTDLVSSLVIYQYELSDGLNPTETLKASVIKLSDFISTGGVSSSIARDYGYIIDALTKFDYAPFYFIIGEGTNHATRITSYASKIKTIGDIYNFSYIANAQMTQLMKLSWYYMINVMKNALSTTR